ncbi:MAG: tol-pal system protein YbgF [Paracoccaceae bacterium]
MPRGWIKFLTLAVALSAANASLAQDKAETLAAIRAELQVLAADLQGLRSELTTGGQAAMQAAGGASALDRMNAMEAELARLTAANEQLQIKVNRVVADGTNRVGDLEFRLCELEEGCDPANLPITQSLGGADAGAAATGTGSDATAGADASAAPQVDLAINEQSDFDQAKAKLDAGDYAGAAAAFAAFAAAYPGGPLTGEAQFLQGEAYSQAGDTNSAAKAYLDAFSDAPEGPRAPAALLRLGAALGLLGKTADACEVLGQVPVRFGSAPEAAEATTAMQGLGCL